MIRANCRARFTAADFDFVVRTLARSQTDQVSLVALLSDSETRDSILDHPRVVDAILNHCGDLRISSQLYFYVLARQRQPKQQLTNSRARKARLFCFEAHVDRTIERTFNLASS
jgi:hypothetical protein